MSSEELLVISNAWPATTIDGDPGVVGGLPSLSRAADGEYLLDISVGPHGGAPEEGDHVQFVLTAEQAHALGGALP